MNPLQIPRQDCRAAILCKLFFAPSSEPCPWFLRHRRQASEKSKNQRQTKQRLRSCFTSLRSLSRVFNESSKVSFSSFRTSTLSSKSSTSSHSWFSSSSLALVLTALRAAFAFFLEALISSSFCFNLTKGKEADMKAMNKQRKPSCLTYDSHQLWLQRDTILETSRPEQECQETHPSLSEVPSS